MKQQENQPCFFIKSILTCNNIKITITTIGSSPFLINIKYMNLNANKLLCFSLMILCWSCKNDSETAKYHNNRNNIMNVRNKIKEIEIDDVQISIFSWLYLIDDYLLISDHHSTDKLIHLFDKKNFSYITSTGYKGIGPNEIANMGKIGINESDHIFYVSDHGKQMIFSFYLDSVLTNPNYMPIERVKTDKSQYPRSYQYVNDTLSIGLIIESIGGSDYKPTIAKWNMNTGEIKPLEYEHPEIEKKRINFAVSLEHNMYIQCYWHHDLITFCDLDGKLKYNIYGQKWDNRKTNSVSFYSDAVFWNDKLIILYSDGKDNFIKDENGNIRGSYPTQFIIFDIDGNYIQTLETGYNILNFCIDKDNNRIIMNLDDEIQFAYLNLDGII